MSQIQQQIDNDTIDILLDWELAKRDPWPFLQFFVRTFDEHQLDKAACPFPATGYARVLCRAWRERNLLFIKKSRQIRMTWQIAAMSLREALFSFNWRQFDQSKKEEDASDSILKKQIFIYEELMKMGLPDVPLAKMTGSKVGTASKLEFPSLRCEITAIPQGPDIIRSYTCSFIFGDEINHQPKAQEGFEGAMPTLFGKGKWWGAGTSNGHTFMWHVMNNRDPQSGKVQGTNKVDSRKIKPTLRPPYAGDPADLKAKEKYRRDTEAWLLGMSDEEFDAIPFEELIANVPGMDFWITYDDKPCLWVHYSADPDKSPETEVGLAWKIAARKLFPSDASWNREMEGNDDTFEGRPVIANWSDATHVKAYEYDSEETVHISQDYGTEVNVTFFAQLVPVGPTEKQLRFLDERVGRRSDAIAQASAAMECMREMFPRAVARRTTKSYCDPNGNQESDTTSDKSLNSRIKIQREISGWLINPSSRKFGDKDSTQAMEDAFALILSNGEPAVVVHPRCTYLRSCLSGGLHYEQGDQSGHYAKDGEYDHGGDACRYMVANLFDSKLLAGTKKKATHDRVAIRGYGGRIIKWEKRINAHGVNLRRQGLLNVRQ